MGGMEEAQASLRLSLSGVLPATVIVRCCMGFWLWRGPQADPKKQH